MAYRWKNICCSYARLFSKSKSQNVSWGITRIFSELIKQNRLVVVDKMVVDEPKTKVLINKLHSLQPKDATDKKPARNILIISEIADANLILAARNVPVVSVCNRSNLSPVDLIAHDMVIIESEALKKVEEALS